MYAPESFSESTSSASFPRPSVPWAPPSVPPPEIVSEEEEAVSSLLILLEDDVASVENNLHVMLYTLQSLKTAVRTPISIQQDALQILGELKVVDYGLSKLVGRLEEISVGLGGLSYNATKRELEKQYIIIDKTLVAAEEMRKELRLGADTISLKAHDLAKPMGAAGS